MYCIGPAGPVGLQQLRWPATNISDTQEAAKARMVKLPGSHYRDPEFSWKQVNPPAGIGFVRGNSLLSTDLNFVRIEPFVVPKRSLTGESTERVDTRVLQVIYAIEPTKQPLFVGQQMDVFLNAE